MEDIYIIKNDGTREVFDSEKIYKHLTLACKNLDDVDIITLIKNARLKIFNNIKSVDIQNSLIKAAQEMISEEAPVYELVAGRLLNQKIRKEVYNQYEPLNFKNCMKERISKGYYTKDLLNYTEEELDYFNSLINYELDEYLIYSALNQFYSKYLIKIDNKLIETPQEVFMLIPMAIFYNQPEYYRKKYVELGYKLLSQKKISLPTPIMNGARTNYKKYISCNLINFGDSVDSFAKAFSAILSCTAEKSGLGINTSFIRGLGADVGNPVRMKHTGVLPLIKTIEFATNALSQIGRGGSSNLTMPFYHYEIELFSQLGDSKGSLENRARHTDQTIIINMWFLKKALAKEDIYLFHMDKVDNKNRDLDLYDALGDEERFDKLYNMYAKQVSGNNKKLINAWNLLNLIIYERMITGRVYIVFADNFVKSSYKENLYFTNLCTEISQPAKSLDGYRNEVGEIGCCILGNMNLGYATTQDIPKIADFLVNFLDTLVDVADYRLPEIEYAAKNRRGLGIGISNLFGYLAKSKQFYNLKDTRENIHDIMELFYFHLLKASNKLAENRGKCKLFDESYYSDNKFIFERYGNSEFKNKIKNEDWEDLRINIEKYGLRNSSLCSIPPAGNSAKISGSTSGIEPPRELITIKTEKNATIKQLVPFYMIAKKYYTTAWGDDFNNIDYLKLVAVIQKFVDQSISLNLYYNVLNKKDKKISIEQVLDEMILSFQLGIKTWYYANFRTTDDSDGIDKIESCGSGGCAV